MTKEEIVIELRSIIFDYQKTMTKDTEQSLKNLIDMIEGYEDNTVTISSEEYDRLNSFWNEHNS
tara:strand:+ start:82 stop:273 length:192 start_codon:yes stop_codon:yes gene_type:complete